VKFWHWLYNLFGRHHMTIIRIINHSSLVSDAEVKAAAAAQQIQITRDFAPLWGKSAQILVGKLRRHITEWAFVLADSIDAAGALGYHTVHGAVPAAIIDVKLCQQDGVSWTSCLSHEVLEALADPFCNLTWPYPGGKTVAWEVGDPVERDGYFINGIQMSNFVTPAWFQGGPGPYDFLKVLSAPLTLSKGGYISVHDSSGWHQIFADTTRIARSTRTRDRGAVQI